jgi:hypothetical protein
MTAQVLSPVSINGVPAKVGDIIEADERTITNLTRKGKLGPVQEEQKDEQDEPKKSPRKPKP